MYHIAAVGEAVSNGFLSTPLRRLCLAWSLVTFSGMPLDSVFVSYEVRARVVERALVGKWNNKQFFACVCIFFRRISLSLVKEEITAM